MATENRTLVAERHSYGLVALWQNRRLGVALAVGIAALAGLPIGVALSRGLTTQAQTLLVLAGGALVGALSGLTMRSRRAMLLAPLAHIVTLEITRPQLLGQTVGAICLSESYGVLVFALGRGLNALVVLIPPAQFFGSGTASVKDARFTVTAPHCYAE